MYTKPFKLKLRHDNGVINILLNAVDEQSAIEYTMNHEKCPRQAIISVKEA